MDPIEIDRAVAAPAADVWALMTDVDGWTEVVDGIRAVERLDDGSGFGVGTRWRETRVMFGREATEEMEVTAIAPGREYTVEADGQGAHYVTRMGVEPTGDDTSRIWTSFGGEPTSALSRVMAATVGKLFEGTTRKMMAQDLDGIAAAAEARTGG